MAQKTVFIIKISFYQKNFLIYKEIYTLQLISHFNLPFFMIFQYCIYLQFSSLISFFYYLLNLIFDFVSTIICYAFQCQFQIKYYFH